MRYVVMEMVTRVVVEVNDDTDTKRYLKGSGVKCKWMGEDVFNEEFVEYAQTNDVSIVGEYKDENDAMFDNDLQP